MDALNPESGLKPETDQEPGLDRRTRRNLLLLTCCQAVGQSCNTMMFAATGLSVLAAIAFLSGSVRAQIPEPSDADGSVV